MKDNPRTVWDLPLRLFHWLLVGLVIFSYWSAENDHMDWHVVSGLTITGLLVFRIFWGFWGPETARFSSFVKGPKAVLADIRDKVIKRQSSDHKGHSPVGGWAALVLILAVSIQAGLGLFSHDQSLTQGPLAYLVSEETSDVLSEIHEEFFSIILVLIGLHLAAVLYYWLVLQQNLVMPMIIGKQSAAQDHALKEAPERPSAFRFLLAVLLAAGAVALILYH